MPLRPLLPLLLVLVPLPARGQPPAQPPALPPSVAKLVTRGIEACGSARPQDGVTVLEQALEVAIQAGVPERERGMIYGELGVCEGTVGNAVEAANYLREAMASQSSLTQQQIRVYSIAYDSAIRGLGMMWLNVDPPHARVYLDGTPLPPPPALTGHYGRWVKPGQHTVRGKLEGHTDAETNITVAAADLTAVTLALQPEPPPPAPAAPAPERMRPASAAPPSPRPRRDTRPPPRGDDPAAWRTVGAVVAGSGAAVAIGMALAAAVVTRDGEREANAIRKDAGPVGCRGAARPAACDALADTIATRDALAAGAIGGLIASSAIGLVTLSSLAWAPSRPARGGVRVLPMATGDAGVAIRASW